MRSFEARGLSLTKTLQTSWGDLAVVVTFSDLVEKLSSSNPTLPLLLPLSQFFNKIRPVHFSTSADISKKVIDKRCSAMI